MGTPPPSGTFTEAKRTFDVPAARVFRAWTDPAELATWAWGSLGRDVTAEVDARVGGSYRIQTSVDDAQGWPHTDWAMRGTYVEVEPDRRLVYTLQWDAPVGYNQGDQRVPDEIVAVDLTEEDGKTHVAVRHFGMPADPDGISATAHGKALVEVLAYLARTLD